MKTILSVLMEEDGENVSLSSHINESFKVSPEIAGTMLISVLDILSQSVPSEQLQKEFEKRTIYFFHRNFSKRYSSQELDYNKD
jgi:hypothetical protein